MSAVENKEIVVNYKTYKEYCSCCSREFEEKELSDFREFDINIKSLFEWAQWESKDDIYEEEISSIVEEYLYDTIRFYAVDGNNELELPKDEVKKVETIVREVIRNM